jgi:putative membrane protein insertion efficiency factor
MSSAVPADDPSKGLLTTLAGSISSLLVWLLERPILFYRKYISPTLPPACRYEPSCSRYALDALHQRGPLVGSLLTLWRLCRCQPLGGHGYDPVPPRRRPRPENP